MSVIDGVDVSVAEVEGVDVIEGSVVEDTPEAKAEVQLSNWRSIELAPTVEPEAMRSLEKTFLGGQHFNLDRVTEECRYWETVHVSSALELGRRLYVVKQVLPKKGFTAWLEGVSGLRIGYDMAYRYMRLAKAVAERGGLKLLADAPIGHAVALLSLPENYLDEMAESGTLDGVPVSELKSTTRKDLLARINQLKKQGEAKDAALTKAREEAEAQKEIAQHFKAKVGEATFGLKERPRRAEVRDRLHNHRKTMEQHCRYLEAMNLEGVDEETAADMAAHLHWCEFRMRTLRLQVTENLANEINSVERPAPFEWNEAEAMKVDFEDRVEENPL